MKKLFPLLLLIPFVSISQHHVYTISWALFVEEMCDPEPVKEDEFGRTPLYNVSLSVHCSKRVYKGRKLKSFKEKKEADAFLKRLIEAVENELRFKLIDSIKTNYK